MLATVDQLAMGTITIIYQVALLQERSLCSARPMRRLVNAKELKKPRIRLGGSLAIQDAHNLLDYKAISKKVGQEPQPDGNSIRGGFV